MSVTPSSTVSLKDSIATKLLKEVFGLYLLIAITVTLIHMVAEFYDTKDSIALDLIGFQETFEPGLADVLWNMNPSQLQSILKGMIKVPTIVGVKIENDDGEQVGNIGVFIDQTGRVMGIDTLGKEVSFTEAGMISKLIEHRFPIMFKDLLNNEKSQAGIGTIYSSTEIVFQKVQYGFIFIIVNSIIKTLALWIIFLWVSRRLLARPLTIFTTATEQMNLDNLANFRVDVQIKGRNELKILEEAFNSLAQKLAMARNELVRALESLNLAHQRTALLLEGTRKIIFAQTRFVVMENAVHYFLQTLPFLRSAGSAISDPAADDFVGSLPSEGDSRSDYQIAASLDSGTSNSVMVKFALLETNHQRASDQTTGETVHQTPNGPTDVPLHRTRDVGPSEPRYASLQMPVLSRPKGNYLYRNFTRKIEYSTHPTSLEGLPIYSTSPQGCFLIENTLNVPIWHNQHLLGHIEIQGLDGQSFNKGDREFVDTLAETVGITLDRFQSEFQR